MDSYLLLYIPKASFDFGIYSIHILSLWGTFGRTGMSTPQSRS